MERRLEVVVDRPSPVELIIGADLNDETGMPLSLVQTPVDCVPTFAGSSMRSAVAASIGTVSSGGIGGGSWLRTMVERTAPGAYLLGKLDRFKQRRRETNRRRITEKELRRLNRKIVSDEARYLCIQKYLQDEV